MEITSPSYRNPFPSTHLEHALSYSIQPCRLGFPTQNPTLALPRTDKRKTATKECRAERVRGMASRSTAASMSDIATHVCNKLQSIFQRACDSSNGGPVALDVAVEEIAAVAAADRRGRIFVHGVGREGLMMKALCMRLAHLGLSAHCVGDMTTPPISANDLLIASAGPGGFPTVDAICDIAGSAGARVLLLTSKPSTGSACKFASAIAFLPAQTMADEPAEGGSGSGLDHPLLLPMGSAYEGAMFVLFEMVIFKLAQILGQTPHSVTARHTNLE